MGEYKVISITNVSLAENDWQFVISRLSNLGRFVQVKQGKLACMSGKSTKKKTFSVDCGALTTEYNAFLLAIKFYVGEHINGIRIGEMK